jgi:N-acyl-L-homoserine lactone synthetase
MIHIVSKANRHRYVEQIAEMHRIRKRWFVDTLKWSGPTVVGDQEFDSYDDELAEYLLGLDPRTGAVRAGIRMRPASDSSMLADVFPHLVSKGRAYVLGPTTWEGTRLFAAADARSDEDKQLMREVYVGVVEFGFLRGYDRFTGLGDVRHIPMMRAGTWRTTILGPPVADAEGEWFAFEARVDEESLAFARERRGVSGPLLIELPAIGVRDDLPPHLAAAEYRSA